MRKTISPSILLFLFVLEANAALATPIGVVERASGDVWIYSRKKIARHVRTGDLIESEISITTDPGASVVLQFRDGQIVVLGSNATFRVNNYVFNTTEPAKGQISFELVKGGMHSVTGTIGESNRSGWQLVTPSAILKIKGTDFLAVIEDGLYTHVKSGSVILANSAGTLTVSAGGTAFVASDETMPVARTAVPDELFAGLQPAPKKAPAGSPSTAAGSVASAGTPVSQSVKYTAIAIAVGVAAIAAAASGGSSSTNH
jgi:hypothetical protein